MLPDFKKVTKIKDCLNNPLSIGKKLYKPLKGWILLFLPSFNGRCNRNIAEKCLRPAFSNSAHRL